MPVIEQLGTFTATQERVEHGYVIDGETTEAAALAALLAAAPTSVTVAGYAIPRRADECRVDETEVLNVWEGTAVYAVGGSTTEEGNSFGFQVGGDVVHLTHGLKFGDKHYVKEAGQGGAAPPDYKGAIGVVTGDGGDRIEGVDIQAPKATFTLGRTLPPSTFTASYERTIARMVGKVNSDIYRGYSAGELLLVSVSANQPDAGEDVRVTAGYAVSENTSADIDLGNNVTITGGKEGWDYLWVNYAEILDAVTGIVVKRPVAAYVSRVYERTAFSALGFS